MFSCTNNFNIICNKEVDFKLYLFTLSFFVDYEVVNMHSISMAEMHRRYVAIGGDINYQTFKKRFRYLIEVGLFKEVIYFEEKCLEINQKNIFLVHNSIIDRLIELDSESIRMYFWLNYKYVPDRYDLVVKVSDIIVDTGRSATNMLCKAKYKKAMLELGEKTIVGYEEIQNGVYRIFLVKT